MEWLRAESKKCSNSVLSGFFLAPILIDKFYNFLMIVYFLLRQGGMYVFQMFDYQAGGISLVLIAFLETMGVGWFYGEKPKL